MLQNPLILAFAFLVGLTVGSFLNVVIYRLPREMSLVRPNSRCPKCSAPVRWWMNIPVLSFVFLRGKCAACRAPISWRYPLVEISTGILFTVGCYYATGWIELPFFAYFLSALIVCTLIDFEHWIIPDAVTLPGIIVGLLGAWLIPTQSLAMHTLGAVIGGGMLFGLAIAYEKYAKQEGLGGGDVKFLAMAGAFLGVEGVLITVILAAFSGSLFGVSLIVLRGKGGKTAIPFGPFLSAGALAAFLFGERLWQWYFNFT
jgi:leader peptidase (prepilin peptidase)/N-methyltransferase